jgi:hypothetical protein
MGLVICMLSWVTLSSSADCPASKIDDDVKIVTTGGLWKEQGYYGTCRVVVRDEGWEEVRSKVILEWLVTNESQRSRMVKASAPLLELNERGWNNVQNVKWVGSCMFEISYLKYGEEKATTHIGTATLLAVGKYEFREK